MKPTARLMFCLLLCAAAAIGAGSAILWRQSERAHASLASGAWILPARTLPDFSLLDHRGRKFSRANLRGHWSLLFFGYSHCPDVCPTTLSLLSQVHERLKSQVGSALPEVIFVSVDAVRDTPATLARYVPYFDPSFTGVTAVDQPGIEALAKSWGVAVLLHPLRDGGYSVDHSAEIFVIDPEARVAAILSGPFDAASLQNDLQRILAART